MPDDPGHLAVDHQRQVPHDADGGEQQPGAVDARAGVAAAAPRTRSSRPPRRCRPCTRSGRTWPEASVQSTELGQGRQRRPEEVVDQGVDHVDRQRHEHGEGVPLRVTRPTTAAGGPRRAGSRGPARRRRPARRAAGRAACCWGSCRARRRRRCRCPSRRGRPGRRSVANGWSRTIRVTGDMGISLRWCAGSRRQPTLVRDRGRHIGLRAPPGAAPGDETGARDLVLQTDGRPGGPASRVSHVRDIRHRLDRAGRLGPHARPGVPGGRGRGAPRRLGGGQPQPRAQLRSRCC